MKEFACVIIFFSILNGCFTTFDETAMQQKLQALSLKVQSLSQRLAEIEADNELCKSSPREIHSR